PATVTTHVYREPGKQGVLGVSRWIVRGTTSDNGTVRRVVVNGKEARALAANFAEWEAVLDEAAVNEGKLSAHAEDAAGNVEKLSHKIAVSARSAAKER